MCAPKPKGPIDIFSYKDLGLNNWQAWTNVGQDLSVG